jgi:ketosteroid isomerase-like protein
VDVGEAVAFLQHGCHLMRRRPTGPAATGDTSQTMSRENVEIVRRCVEAMNPRDLSAELPPDLLELVDPDAELDLSRNVFNPAVYRGHSGLEQWRSEVVDVWESFHGELEELIDAGERVVTATTIRGKGKGSGVDVEMLVFQVWTVRDSKVVRLVGGYRDRSEALEDAGLGSSRASEGV